MLTAVTDFKMFLAGDAGWTLGLKIEDRSSGEPTFELLQ
jgi:hypothetical protein